jgi:phosphotransferase family enzyme
MDFSILALNERGNGMIKDVMTWAKEYLNSHCYSITSEPDVVQKTPWSCVLRFSTSKGYIYLKQMPKELSLESPITQMLFNRFSAQVPFIIGENQELSCFLMKDAGQPLRTIFKNGFQLTLLIEGIKIYKNIQFATADHVNVFLDMGVPNWGLTQWAALYADLIRQEKFLIEDGLTEKEIHKLHLLQPKFNSICDQLAQFNIPAVLDHSDFHDNNMLIDDAMKYITIIDWGESVITHPYFSLVGCIRNAAWRYQLNNTPDILQQLEKVCFSGVSSDAVSLTWRLGPIYFVFINHRTMMANFNEYKSYSGQHHEPLIGRLARGFRDFITNESI